MRSLLLFAFVASVSAFVDVQKNYHDAVGIPLAAKIKASEENPEPYAKIVGGAIAPPGAQPYFGGLLISFSFPGQSVCGSTLVSPNRALTAAHCWFDGTRQAIMLTVIFNSNQLFTGGTRVFTNQVVMHPQWNFMNLNNDVAVIYLPTWLPTSAAIQPISIPTQAEALETFTGHWGLATGFGKTSDFAQTASTVLSRVNLQVIPNTQCSAVFGNQVVVPSTLCTNGFGAVGICGGDSGGPLIANYNGRIVLIGISSFVAAGSGGVSMCQQGFPSAFARVSSFHQFITQNL